MIIYIRGLGQVKLVPHPIPLGRNRARYDGATVNGNSPVTIVTEGVSLPTEENPYGYLHIRSINGIISDRYATIW